MIACIIDETGYDYEIFANISVMKSDTLGDQRVEVKPKASWTCRQGLVYNFE